MKVPVPVWILALGGVGIVVGLATWGYRVIETVGKKITHITPSRGFSAQFATATTVLVCSKMGLPISTSHTLVGSVIGVGLARGIAALNLSVILSIVNSWIITIPATAIVTVVIYLGLKMVAL
jgi:phosphate/sulfate permease